MTCRPLGSVYFSWRKGGRVWPRAASGNASALASSREITGFRCIPQSFGRREFRPFATRWSAQTMSMPGRSVEDHRALRRLAREQLGGMIEPRTVAGTDLVHEAAEPLTIDERDRAAAESGSREASAVATGLSRCQLDHPVEL